MAGVLDSDGFGAVAFLAVALAAAVAWRAESGRLARLDSVARPSLWPLFWLLLASAYAAIALVLTSDLVSTLGGIGRDYARVGRWYESRRPFQVAAIAAVATVWLGVVVVGIWRVPERRRRYLPSAMMLTTLVCFAVIRLISLHQVDTVVRRTAIAGVPVGTVLELAGLVVALALVAVGARRPVDMGSNVAEESPRPPDRHDSDSGLRFPKR